MSLDWLSTYNPDPAAVRDLLGAYWSAVGWRDVPARPADHGKAVEAGLMFPDDVSTWRLDHDQTIEAVRSATAQISATDAGNAFLASLTSRRLDLRSALGSFAVARNLPNHPFQPGTDRVFCRICGLPPQPDAIDLNKFNFERFKWGVRSTTI